MADKTTTSKKPLSADWFVQGLLTRLGDAFDRLMGRGWKPSSSLATSELAERMRSLVDAEIREDSDGRKFVPHNIKLKMQWDKFSTDSTEPLRKLEVELLTSLVDHINDRRYYTYAPISLEVKPDYFTNGVKLYAGFENAGEEDSEASLDVSVPSIQLDLAEAGLESRARHQITAKLDHEIGGRPISKTVTLNEGERLTVGRTKESDLSLDDPSVSKMHASLLLDSEGMLVLSDTGSTNGTFVDGERIAYGKAIKLSPGQDLRFGTVDVSLSILERTDPIPAADEVDAGDKAAAGGTLQVGDFQFTSKHSELEPADRNAATEPSIPVSAASLHNGKTESLVPELNGNDGSEVDLSKEG